MITLEIFEFTPIKHIIYTIITNILTFAIFLRGSKIYNKTCNPKILIIAVACLINFLFTIMHLTYSMLADLVYKTDLYYYIQFDYHTVGAITLAISCVVSALFAPNLKTFSKEKFKQKTYIIFLVIFIFDVIIIELLRYFLPTQLEIYSAKFIASNPSLEVFNNALFILTAFIYSDTLKMAGRKSLSLLPIGFFILGAGTIYLFNSEFLTSYHRSAIHIFRNIGFLFIFMGLKRFPTSECIFNFRQKILAYPAITLIAFSFLYFSICFIFFNVELPERSLYFFLILYIFTLFVTYAFSSKLSSPITTAIQYLDQLKPGIPPVQINAAYNDEIGLLIDKIKNSAEENWKYSNELKAKQINIQQLNEKEALIGKITQTIRSSLDLDKTLYLICEQTAKLLNVQRAAISTSPNIDNISEFTLLGEYIASPEFKSVTQTEHFDELALYWEENIINNGGTFAIDNIEESDTPDFFKETYKEIGVKSIIGKLIKNKAGIWGQIVLSEYKKYRHWTEEEISLIDAITDQVYIAIRQAELYSDTKKQAERESLLRKLIELVRSSINIKSIKHEMVAQIGLALGADRVAFADYDFETEKYVTLDGNEYRSSDKITTLVGYDLTAAAGFIETIRDLHLAGKDVIFSDLDKYLDDNDLEKSMIEIFYREMDIMSLMAINIKYGDKFYGNLVVTYSKKQKITNDDVEFVKTLANQAAIGTYQYKLFEKEKLMAERERISRNIIEILRSSIDKTIIKKLFVKNIGRLFKSNRVFIAEYNAKEKMYSPVDKDSEYLSDANEKSIVDYDWSTPAINNHVQLLLEKREVKIPVWSEYIENNPKASEESKFLYGDSDIKSSYSFPVMYQDKIMGFFCLEFTHQECILSEEDLGRIRNICTQAGMALYHAELYLKAQECISSEKSCIAKISQKIEAPVTDILKASTLLSKNEFERSIQIVHLNEIIYSCYRLLDLTKENSDS